MIFNTNNSYITNFKFQDELGKIQKSILKMQAFELLSYLKTILQKQKFEIHHPEDKARKLVCVNSYLIGNKNILVMKCLEDSNYNCLLVQFRKFITYILTKENSYLIANNHNREFSNLEFSKKINTIYKDKIKNLFKTSKKTIGLNLLVGKERPFHFFFDNFVNLNFFSELENLKYNGNKSCYFLQPHEIYKNLTPTFDKEPIYICPFTYYNVKKWNLPKNDFFMLRKKMQLDLINSLKLHKQENVNFTIHLGLLTDRKSLINQEQFYIAIIQLFYKIKKKLIVLIDGMTAYQGQKIFVQKEEEILSRIKKHFKNNKNIKIIGLLGVDYIKKIEQINLANFFIANVGTNAIIPLFFLNKQGLMHGSHKTILVSPYSKKLPKERVQIYPKHLVQSKKNTGAHYVISYSIDIQQAVKFTYYFYLKNINPNYLNLIKYKRFFFKDFLKKILWIVSIKIKGLLRKK